MKEGNKNLTGPSAIPEQDSAHTSAQCSGISPVKGKLCKCLDSILSELIKIYHLFSGETKTNTLSLHISVLLFLGLSCSQTTKTLTTLQYNTV